MYIKFSAIRSSIIIILLLFSSAICYSQTIQKKFKDLYSLLGTWGMETKKGMLFESWQKINDSTLKSKSFKVSGTDTMLIERVELIAREQKIMYIPTTEYQNDQKPVVFTLSKLKDGIYTFENPEHDFPQRIVYTLPSGNAMFVWIEGVSKGKFGKSEYHFNRIQ